MSNTGLLTNSCCTACGADRLKEVISIPDVPVHCNQLWTTETGACAAPRSNIQLRFCTQCGHFWNAAFEPELMEYTQDYENSLHFSPRFQEYAARLAARLVERYDLRAKDIIEIGSGQGDFLALLCELGGNRGVGFDPSYTGRTEDHTQPVSFVRDFYSEKYAGYPADFICSRHVLEHIHYPAEFLAMVRRVIGKREHIITFFEVPNALFTLRELGIWDIIYEHCSYFTPHSLTQVFSRNGFQMLETHETFGGQFLTIEARPGVRASAIENLAELKQMEVEADQFAGHYRDKIQSWQRRLEHLVEKGQRAVVWGAGSKGVTFLNVLKAHLAIEYVVDINPRKHGMYVAGSGQAIVAPEFLKTCPPQAVIIMNANYKAEIQQRLQALDVDADIVLA